MEDRMGTLRVFLFELSLKSFCQSSSGATSVVSSRLLKIYYTRNNRQCRKTNNGHMRMSARSLVEGRAQIL